MSSKTDSLSSGMSSLSVKSSKKPLKSKPKTVGSSKKSSTATDPALDAPVGDEPLITAYSQQSRFHRETFDANTTDIDIKGVHVSVGSKDILVDAHLRLKAGVKYGMVGQNGVGKSVLMSVLGNNILIGLPQNVKFLHIQQLEEFAPGRTVLQEVLESDVERMRIIREAKALQSINQFSKTYEDDLSTAIHTILVERSAAALALAQKRAAKLSGQRGYEARQDLLKAEAKHAALVRAAPGGSADTGTTSPAIGSGDGEGEAVAVETFEFTQKLANETMRDVLEAYELIDEAADEQRARAILRGLGFKDDELNVDVKTGTKGGAKAVVSDLSGGWRMRVMLAKALFVKPDVLLLDEPTNHLDLPAILWLEHHLLNSPDVEAQTIVVVSHDRYFLDAVTTETIIFKDKVLKYHNGNYEDWEKGTEEQKRRKERLIELDEKRKKKIMASIQKNVAAAKSTGDDKRLGMVASRKKALDRLGMQQLEDGKRYKRSYHGYRAEITIESGFNIKPITLPTPHAIPMHSPSILQLCDVTFKYPGTPASAPPIIDKVSLDIGPSSRIGFLGPNGCGKSTLMNLLAGVVKPTKGEVRRAGRVRVGYFSQWTVGRLGMDRTPLEELRAWYSDDHATAEGGAVVVGEGERTVISEAQARAHFASSVGISGAMVTKQKIGSMSGGERNRVALGCVTFFEPHVLLLDEITNHLDMGSVESVVEAVRGFEGAVVVVSHDVWFLKGVVEGFGDDDDDGGDGSDGEEEKGVLYVVNGKFGGLRRWEDGVDAYVERVRRRAVKAFERGE